MIATNARQTVEGYIDGVMSGDILVGKRIRQAVERHLRDLKQAETDDQFGYYFDWGCVEGIMTFASCCRHSVGEWAGQPFIPEPWQAFALAMIHGWRRRSDGGRRFSFVYLSTARKNGKSFLGAVFAHYHGGCDINPETRKPEATAQVVIAATKRDQADKVLFAEANRMLDGSPPLARRAFYRNKAIHYANCGGEIFTVSSASANDGYNPSAVLIDELHAWKDHNQDAYDTAKTGSGTRSHPILYVLTTAGSDTSYLWIDEYLYARAVCEGTIEDNSTLCLSWEIDDDDDPLDPEVWAKANPNLGVSVKWSYLHDLARPAHRSVKKRRAFQRYHANQQVSARQRAFDLASWDKCKGELSDWGDAVAIGIGIDVGGRDDLAAMGACAKFEIDDNGDGKQDGPTFRYEVRSWAYIADNCRRDVSVQPFADWIDQGILTQCKYPLNEMETDLIQFDEGCQVDMVAFDPHGAQMMAENCEQNGIEAVSMQQTTTQFAEPINELLAAVADGRLTHDGCPLLRWSNGNAVLITDTNLHSRFDKKSSKEKIDPTVAVTMALRMAMIADLQELVDT